LHVSGDLAASTQKHHGLPLRPLQNILPCAAFNLGAYIAYGR